MKDIQSQRDSRKIDIRKAGVKTISYPIVVLDKAQSRQHTVAHVNMYVNLPHQFKGTHMSRFVEILSETHGRIDIRNFQDILAQMKSRLNAKASHLEMHFPYFLDTSKQNGSSLPARYQCGLHGCLDGESEIKLSLSVPVFHKKSETNLKERWGKVDFLIGFHRFYWLEDIIELVENTIDTEFQNNRNGITLTEGNLANILGRKLEDVDEISDYTITVYKENENFMSFSKISNSC